MSKSIGFEVQFFFVSVVWGVVLLIVYDFLRIFRRIIPHSWEFVAIEDLLFWITSGMLIFNMMYEQNNGIIRGFSIFGMTLGMLIYNHYISRGFVKETSSLLHKIFGLMVKVILFILRPLRWDFRRVKWILLFVQKRIVKFAMNLLKRLKKTFRTVKIAVGKK